MICTLLTTMLSGTTTSALLKHAGQEIVSVVLVRGESSRIAVMLSCALQTPQRTTCEYGGGTGVIGGMAFPRLVMLAVMDQRNSGGRQGLTRAGKHTPDIPGMMFKMRHS
jgi:hypothetical protein